MEIVINKCYGGFGISEAVIKELGTLGTKMHFYGMLANEDFGIEDGNEGAYRADPRLIAAVKKIGLENSSGPYAELEIACIPDEVEWEICEYDGMESIREVSRVW